MSEATRFAEPCAKGRRAPGRFCAAFSSPDHYEASKQFPAPAGNFSIWLLTCSPDQPILDGNWRPPVVSRTPKS